MYMKKNLRIGIVTGALDKANIPPLINFVNICLSISEELYIIKGTTSGMLSFDDSKVHIHLINHKASTNKFTRIINFAYTQLRISYKLATLSRYVDVWLFPIGNVVTLLPAMLLARILQKSPVLAISSSKLKMVRLNTDTLDKIFAYSSSISLKLAKRIVVFSPRHIEKWGLQKYQHKIRIAHNHFFDLDKFKPEKKFSERGNLIGYIGRLSQEKGIMNLLAAMPQIQEWDGDSEVEILIAGDGPLQEKVKRFFDDRNFDNNVKFMGWIPHDEIPRYLNELALLILPSYTEGLPFIMLEAMACGTPVLATPVGAIPDVIKDGETGFIMENNNPECIARNVKRALKYPTIEKISKNARRLVEKEFTFENAKINYETIFRFNAIENYENY